MLKKQLLCSKMAGILEYMYNRCTTNELFRFWYKQQARPLIPGTLLWTPNTFEVSHISRQEASGNVYCAVFKTVWICNDLPYILPSSDNMIFLLPQGGYIARASWKLCSISGLQTPSASLSIGLSAESLILSMSSAGLSLPLQLLGSMVVAGWSKP